MYSDGSALRQLSKDECLTLMASVPVGRIIYTRRALPAVELVSFAFDQGDIVIRTSRSGKLAAAGGTVVAFEADCLDPAHQAGWSVTAIGPSREVSDPVEVARLQAMGLNSWADGARDRFIKISPVMLTGRYLRATALLAALRIVPEAKLAARRPKVPPDTDLGTCSPLTHRDVLES